MHEQVTSNARTERINSVIKEYNKSIVWENLINRAGYMGSTAILLSSR